MIINFPNYEFPASLRGWNAGTSQAGHYTNGHSSSCFNHRGICYKLETFTFPICLLVGATGILDLIAPGAHRCCPIIVSYWLNNWIKRLSLDDAVSYIIKTLITQSNYVCWNVENKTLVLSWVPRCWFWHLAYLVFVTFISFLSILSSEKMTISQHHILFHYTICRMKYFRLCSVIIPAPPLSTRRALNYKLWQRC